MDTSITYKNITTSFNAPQEYDLLAYDEIKTKLKSNTLSEFEVRQMVISILNDDNMSLFEEFMKNATFSPLYIKILALQLNAFRILTILIRQYGVDIEFDELKYVIYSTNGYNTYIYPILNNYLENNNYGYELYNLCTYLPMKALLSTYYDKFKGFKLDLAIMAYSDYKELILNQVEYEMKKKENIDDIAKLNDDQNYVFSKIKRDFMNKKILLKQIENQVTKINIDCHKVLQEYL